MKKILLYAGLAAPVIYTTAVIVGGALWQGYSPLSQAISELTGAGAPNQDILQPLFSLYNWLLLVFGYGLLIHFRKRTPKAIQTASILIIISQIFSLSWVFFPMDIPGTPATFQGIMHLVVAGLVAPLTIAIPLAFGLGFKKMTEFQNFAALSLVFSGIIFATGITSALSISLLPHLLGLFERLVIFSYQCYIFLLAITTLKSFHAVD